MAHHLDSRRGLPPAPSFVAPHLDSRCVLLPAPLVQAQTAPTHQHTPRIQHNKKCNARFIYDCVSGPRGAMATDGGGGVHYDEVAPRIQPTADTYNHLSRGGNGGAAVLCPLRTALLGCYTLHAAHCTALHVCRMLPCLCTTKKTQNTPLSNTS